MTDTKAVDFIIFIFERVFVSEWFRLGCPRSAGLITKTTSTQARESRTEKGFG